MGCAMVERHGSGAHSDYFESVRDHITEIAVSRCGTGILSRHGATESQYSLSELVVNVVRVGLLNDYFVLSNPHEHFVTDFQSRYG